MGITDDLYIYMMIKQMDLMSWLKNTVENFQV